VRFELDCTADRDGRLKRTLGWEDGSPVPFYGTLELLIEDHTPRRPAAKPQTAPGIGDEP
jgi:hypothetical protein